MKHVHIPGDITADYLTYLRELPPDEKRSAENMLKEQMLHVFYLGDGTGQHAVKIELPTKGVHWVHVLVYDQANRRTGTAKYRNGRYAC